MFSIYAVGVMKGYRRETRVRIHAVVDFRTRQRSGRPRRRRERRRRNARREPNAAPAATPTQTPAASIAGAIAAANMPSTGGQIVYYRVE